MADGTVEHDEEAINFNMERGICGFCHCNNGSFAFCTQIEFPYIRDDTGSSACTVDGRTISHRMTYEDAYDFNVCRCINGVHNEIVLMMKMMMMMPGIDEDNNFAECRRMPFSSVCN